MSRRTVLAGGAAAAALAALGPQRLAAGEQGKVPAMPAGYVTHGSPMSALSTTRSAEWRAWADAQPKPRAVLVVSAHYTLDPVTIGATQRLPLVYDFRGFPRELYEIQWSPPGAPELAERVEKLLKPLRRVEHDPERGHDHGAWVPLRAMYPAADVPTLSVSLPTRNTKQLFAIGKALAPLRDEGVFLLGSGAMTHNLRYRHPPGAKPPTWAKEFDAWAKETLEKDDVDALLDWEKRAPAARTNHPTVEHFVPLVLAAGARRAGDVVTFPVTGFDSPIFSNRCVAFGPPPARKGT